MILLQKFSANADLTLVTQTLWRHKVPHRVRFVTGEQQLWLQDSQHYSLAQALMQQVEQGIAADEKAGSASAGLLNSFVMADKVLSTNGVKVWFKSTPITLMVLISTLLVALFSQLGSQLEAVAWFSFFPLVLDTQAYLVTGFDHLWLQPWRLISPMLLHFGWLHLVFNVLWWLDLGRRIECQSRLLLVALLLFTSVAANVAQAWQVASLFGGLSGVIYGLLGYIWVMDRYNPVRYHLPQNILIFMLLWLLLGISGLFPALGFGDMANMAHIGGLVAGVAWGFMHTLLWRIRSSNA
jgi:GlpG protein|tara:strand:- start:20786 stop:21673 length:888 start_codon:yes stop_codon:yes gene_type:complete